ncbi:MAG: transporter [Lachnospiraceae bacterium]|jgi:drug/metabolite transporter (DMT)-like permease|nr:transporter [Lachnospiraceae bacterium]
MKLFKNYFCLQSIMFLYSLGGICSKLASSHPFLSPFFFFYYSLALIILGIYAIVWQQLLKNISLITAYANKAVTVIWGLLWGKFIFGESVTVCNIIGGLVIICGIYFMVKSNE